MVNWRVVILEFLCIVLGAAIARPEVPVWFLAVLGGLVGFVGKPAVMRDAR